MANIFWMPIQTRTEMLTTGFRTKLGIKVFGPDLGTIQNIGVQIEKALSDFPDTRSVFAERTTGGYFLDFNVESRSRRALRPDRWRRERHHRNRHRRQDHRDDG